MTGPRAVLSPGRAGSGRPSAWQGHRSWPGLREHVALSSLWAVLPPASAVTPPTSGFSPWPSHLSWSPRTLCSVLSCPQPGEPPGQRAAAVAGGLACPLLPGPLPFCGLMSRTLAQLRFCPFRFWFTPLREDPVPPASRPEQKCCSLPVPSTPATHKPPGRPCARRPWQDSPLGVTAVCVCACAFSFYNDCFTVK